MATSNHAAQSGSRWSDAVARIWSAEELCLWYPTHSVVVALQKSQHTALPRQPLAQHLPQAWLGSCGGPSGPLVGWMGPPAWVFGWFWPFHYLGQRWAQPRVCREGWTGPIAGRKSAAYISHVHACGPTLVPPTWFGPMGDDSLQPDDKKENDKNGLGLLRPKYGLWI